MGPMNLADLPAVSLQLRVGPAVRLAHSITAGNLFVLPEVNHSQSGNKQVLLGKTPKILHTKYSYCDMRYFSHGVIDNWRSRVSGLIVSVHKIFLISLSRDINFIPI